VFNNSDVGLKWRSTYAKNGLGLTGDVYGRTDHAAGLKMMIANDELSHNIKKRLTMIWLSN